MGKTELLFAMVAVLGLGPFLILLAFPVIELIESFLRPTEGDEP